MAGSTLPDPARAAYSGALQTVLRTAPDVARASRAANMAAFLEHGFPTTRDEDWRYTDLAPLSQQGFELAGTAALPDISAWALPDTQRLVFVNGHFHAAASRVDSDTITRRTEHSTPVDEFEKDSVSHLNAALAQDGAILRLRPGQTLGQPLHVLSLTIPGATPAMSHLTHAINLEPGTAATVIFEDLTLGDSAHFLTQRVWLRAMDRAQLDVIRIQNHGPGVQALTRWDASVERDAHLNWTNLDLGGALVRNDLCIELAAAHADLMLQGAFVAHGQTHVDNHTRIQHRWPHGTSRQTYRGIATDRARAIFNGKVVVGQGAVRTDSEQRIASLLLSPQAEINAKPELQIENDDVKCAHGATIGQLDKDALFCLRGLPEQAARQLLLFSFADTAFSQVRSAALRRRLRQRLLERLPGHVSTEELL